jgi:hypothetical protein
MKKIVISGATGLVGKKITQQLIRRGDDVTVLTRSIKNAKELLPGAHSYIEWNSSNSDWQFCLEGKDAVINLAGENLMAKRWNEIHKKNILESRVKGTRALVRAIENLNKKPEIFISASAVGFYGNSETAVNEESKMGNGFLAKVVDAWESESMVVEQFGVRRVNVRLGAVLDKNEGAFPQLYKPFKFFAGGALGNGKQWFPWIHIDDVTGIFLYALDNKNVKGVYNAVSPVPIRMADFCKTLGKIMHRPSFFNVPEFILKIIFGEGADVLLNGTNVLPERTIDAGYVFKYPELTSALKSLLY